MINSEIESRISDYQQTLDYLYAQLPMFSRMGAAAIKKDLTNTRALCEALGNPQTRFKSIHIAGTNGKGSTSHMLAAIFQQAGYKTGLYTSPHLVDFRERIRVNGQMVSQDFVTGFVARHKDLIEEIAPSFFEITVAMAFAAFATEAVDIAIIETGLGGRLDSTNIITPKLSIITNISLDHTDLLGATIPEIAREKAGIIKPLIPVVIGEENAETLPVFREVASTQNAPLFEAYRHWQVSAASGGFLARQVANGTTRQLYTDLTGSYQQYNIATVCAATDVLIAQGWKINEATISTALSRVTALTGLRGRWDIWQTAPLIVADVAHNPAGLKQVLHDWAAVRANTKHIIVGFVRDKDVDEALSLFPKDAHYHFCAAALPRALPADELAAIAARFGLKGTTYASVADAVKSVRIQLAPLDALLICGSFFIVGEAMASSSAD